MTAILSPFLTNAGTITVTPLSSCAGFSTLATVLPRAKIAAVLPVEDVNERVRETANWSGAATSADLRPNIKLAYAAEGNADLYAGFEARIIPENITLRPKTAAQVIR